MAYGRHELAWAEPVAKALVDVPAFRDWLLCRAGLAISGQTARLLHEEMRANRSPRARYWWRSYYTEACRCPGCRGQETDLLAVFEAAGDDRFALHVEVKRPGDKFKNRQAAAYPLRAACWLKNPPRSVLRHKRAKTMLLFAENCRGSHGPHLIHFDACVTFEEIASKFPVIKFGNF